MEAERDERLVRAASFGAVADAYERARPGYPDDAVRWLAGDEPCDVVDLGAGTGKLTRSLVALRHRVTAVEPLEEMLERLRVAVPDAAAVRGSAEEIPLADGSADVVTCAQAFHWFDHAVALSEMAREILSEAVERRSLGESTGHLRGSLRLRRVEAEGWRKALRQSNWRP